MNPGETLLAAYAPFPMWLNFLAFFAVIALSAFAVFLWAVLFRKKRRRKYHRQHRQLNPTLAQSSGLPPIREKEKPPGQTPSH